MPLISDEEQLAEIEFTETAMEYAKYEGMWRRDTNYKAGEKANELDAKLWQMFSRGDWADRGTMATAYNTFRLRLLYKHKRLRMGSQHPTDARPACTIFQDNLGRKYYAGLGVLCGCGVGRSLYRHHTPSSVGASADQGRHPKPSGARSRAQQTQNSQIPPLRGSCLDAAEA